MSRWYIVVVGGYWASYGRNRYLRLPPHRHPSQVSRKIPYTYIYIFYCIYVCVFIDIFILYIIIIRHIYIFVSGRLRYFNVKYFVLKQYTSVYLPLRYATWSQSCPFIGIPNMCERYTHHLRSVGFSTRCESSGATAKDPPRRNRIIFIDWRNYTSTMRKYTIYKLNNIYIYIIIINIIN